jgi:hypothetical protein
MLKKIFIILIIGVFIPVIFVLAETISPTPTASVSPAETPTPSAAATPSPTPIYSPIPSISLSPEDLIKFLSTPSLLISPRGDGVLYAEPNKIINFSATPLNLPQDINLKWYVNGSFISSKNTFSFNSGTQSPAEYLISAVVNLADDKIYNLKGISQISANVTVKVVDGDLYVYAPESVSLLNNNAQKAFPLKNSRFTINVIPFLGNGQFYYNWSINGDLQNQSSGINKSSITILSGSYATTKIISLEVKTSSGNVIWSKKISVPIK